LNSLVPLEDQSKIYKWKIGSDRLETGMAHLAQLIVLFSEC
jgi:hypothetical protein